MAVGHGDPLIRLLTDHTWNSILIYGDFQLLNAQRSTPNAMQRTLLQTWPTIEMELIDNRRRTMELHQKCLRLKDLTWPKQQI